MKKMVLFVSILMNLTLVAFILLIAIHYKEELTQKLIDKRHSADIVMFGDSHTAGVKWNSLIDGYSVKTIGRGGFNTDQLKGLITNSIDYKPKFVFILCGSNDIGSRCFNIDNTIANFKCMADALRGNNITPVFQKLFYQVNNPGFNAVIDTINMRLLSFCKNENIDFLDITDGMMDSTGLRKTMTRDGLAHLNEDGYKVWSKWINYYLKNKK